MLSTPIRQAGDQYRMPCVPLTTAQLCLGWGELVRGFTWEASIEKTLAVYQDVIAASGRRAQVQTTQTSQAHVTQPAAAPAAPAWFTAGVIEPRPAAVAAATVVAPTFATPVPPVAAVSSSVPTSAAPRGALSLFQHKVLRRRSSLLPAAVASPVAPLASSPAPSGPAFDSVLAQGEETAKKGEFAEAHRLLGQAEQL